MKIVKKKKGFMKFMDPDEIVDLAMKDLNKGKVVSVPATDAKIIRIIGRFLPRKLFYKIIINFIRKRNKKLHR